MQFMISLSPQDSDADRKRAAQMMAVFYEISEDDVVDLGNVGFGTDAHSIVGAAPSLIAPATSIPAPPGSIPAAPQTVSVAGAPQNGAVPSNPANNGTNAALDKAGLPWDGRIHASTKTQNKDGTWRKIKGVDANLVTAVEAENRAIMGVNSNDVPAPPSTPTTTGDMGVSSDPADPCLIPAATLRAIELHQTVNLTHDQAEWLKRESARTVSRAAAAQQNVSAPPAPPAPPAMPPALATPPVVDTPPAPPPVSAFAILMKGIAPLVKTEGNPAGLLTSLDIADSAKRIGMIDGTGNGNVQGLSAREDLHDAFQQWVNFKVTRVQAGLPALHD